MCFNIIYYFLFLPFPFLLHIRLAKFNHVLQNPMLLALNPPCMSAGYVPSTKSHLKECVLNSIIRQISGLPKILIHLQYKLTKVCISKTNTLNFTQ